MEILVAKPLDENLLSDFQFDLYHFGILSIGC